MRMKWWLGLLIVAIVPIIALAANPRQRGPLRHGDLFRERVVTIDKTPTNLDNILATHDPDSMLYDNDCLSCHEEVLAETSADPRILSFHQAMIPFMPGYNSAHGVSNSTCIQCHDEVDLLLDSSGALRMKVNPELCALCHGPSGPGPVYYKR